MDEELETCLAGTLVSLAKTVMDEELDVCF
jgi:hypothetical protein